MDDSILLTIKKLLGIGSDYDGFDIDLITHINSIFLTLNQLAVGPENVFCINSEKEKWKDFSIDTDIIGMVKTYIYIKVRIIFDPPASSFVLDAMNRIASEFEWRLNAQAEKQI